MIRIGVLLCLLFSLTSTAATSELSVEKLKARFELKAQAFLTDASGAKLIEYGNYRVTGHFLAKENEIKIHLPTDFKGFPALSVDSTLKINPDLSFELRVSHHQVDQDRTNKVLSFPGSPNSQVYQVKDFGSISYIVKVSPERNVAIRFLPMISEKPEPEKLSFVPMTLTDLVVTDQSGLLWFDGTGSVVAKIARFTGPFGTMYLSFESFPGAEELGTAEQNQIHVKFDEKKWARLRSSAPIVGQGYIAKVYVRYFPEKKSKIETSGWGGLYDQSVDEDAKRY